MSMTETLLDIIPVNIFNSLSEGNMLQIIVFALILGVILANMGDRVDIVKNFFGQFNDIMMEMTMAVMKLAHPIVKIYVLRSACTRSAVFCGVPRIAENIFRAQPVYFHQEFLPGYGVCILNLNFECNHSNEY